MRHLIPVIGLAGAWSLLTTVLLAAGPPENPEAPLHLVTLEWKADSADQGGATVEVKGLDAADLAAIKKLPLDALESLFPVRVEQGDFALDLTVPPVAGEYQVDGETLRFVPGYELQPGVRYRAVFKPGELPDAKDRSIPPSSAVFEIPKAPAGPATVVSHVRPSTDVLPENLLKFYLHFSKPMSRGHVYDHIRLLQENREPVELPFLELDEELWDPAMTRLTLLIDPGRIKTGVRPLEDIGPALEHGKSYTLVISKNWRDATGQPLKADFKKSFHVTEPDRRPPDPKKWKQTVPPAGTRDPLIVRFEKPMDDALARRLITVADDAGDTLDGVVTLTEAERRWVFTPELPWTAGRHRLLVQTTIEDLSGNNIGKPFEVDLFDKVERTLPMTVIELPFDVKPGR